MRRKETHTDHTPKRSNLDAMLWRGEITLDEAIDTMISAYINRIECALTDANPEMHLYIWRHIFAACSPELRCEIIHHRAFRMVARRARAHAHAEQHTCVC